MSVEEHARSVPWVHLGVVALVAAVVAVDGRAWIAACDLWLYDDTPNHVVALARATRPDNVDPLPLFQTTYPPLPYLVTAPFLVPGEMGWGPLLAVQGAFLGLLGIGAWGLGCRMAGRWAGLAAALFTLTAWPVVLNARNYMPDLPAAAGVALATWGLVASRGFSRGPPVVLAAVGLGVALLCKQTAALYLVGPVLWATAGAGRRRWGPAGSVLLPLGLATVVGAGGAFYLGLPRYSPLLVGIAGIVFAAGAVARGWSRWRGERRIPGEGSRSLANLALGLGGAGLGFLPWYVYNYGVNLDYLHSRVGAGRPPVPRPQGLEAWLRAASYVQDQLVGPLVSVLLGVGLVGVWFLGGRSRRAAVGVLLALIPGAVVVGLHTEAQLRYFLPAVPLLMALAGVGLSVLPRPVPALLLAGSVLLVGRVVGWRNPTWGGTFPLPVLERYDQWYEARPARLGVIRAPHGGGFLASLEPFRLPWSLDPLRPPLEEAMARGGGRAALFLWQGATEPEVGGDPGGGLLDLMRLRAWVLTEMGTRAVRVDRLSSPEALARRPGRTGELLVLGVLEGEEDRAAFEACLGGAGDARRLMRAPGPGEGELVLWTLPRSAVEGVRWGEDSSCRDLVSGAGRGDQGG